MKINAYLLPLFLCFAASPGLAEATGEHPDAQVIEQLRIAGSDLSRPHDVDFFFYFPSREQADAAIDDLVSLGYRIVASEASPGQGEWHVHAFRRMVPELGAMSESTRVLNELSARHGGEYDGWGTSVVE
jgi:hypothetical protein